MALAHGNFTGLSKNYTKYRPDYSEKVLAKIFSNLNQPVNRSHLVDVGAGTGIWTRMMAKHSPASIIAVEPNDDMMFEGISNSVGLPIVWRVGSAENTGLPAESCDLVSMASSFHWPDFDKATQEFNRILVPNGCFVALWNPRDMESNPFIQQIENFLTELKPDLKRVSSGSSQFVETLTERLAKTEFFTNVQYFEDRHVRHMTPEQYIGAWRSTNDVPFQLGKEKFEQFIKYAEDKLKDTAKLDVVYLTRAWLVKKRG